MSSAPNVVFHRRTNAPDSQSFSLANYRANYWLGAAFLILALFSPQPANALDAVEAMEKVHAQFRQKPNQQADVRLIIEDKAGNQRVRYFRSLYKIFPGRSKSLVKFYSPPAVRGTALLSESEDGSENASLQWLYLPALKSVKQLAAGDKHKSFMGSDFTNADIAGRNVAQDQHELVDADEKISIVRSTPRDASDPYSVIETHILRAMDVPRRIIFYDQQGNKLKTLKNQAIRRIDGMYVVVRAEMENHQTGGKTILEKESIDVESYIDPQKVGFKGLRH